MRRTHGALAVAKVLLSAPDTEHYGWDLARAAGEGAPTVYRTLSRMRQAGWLAYGWEDPSATAGRPRRRYYTVTERGRVELQAFVGADLKGDESVP